MNIELEWELVEAVGIDFVKESYITVLSCMSPYTSLKESERTPEQDQVYANDVELEEAFTTILRYIMPPEEANKFIEIEREDFL